MTANIKKANETDAANGSDDICRVIDGCQHPPVVPFWLPLASDVAPLHSRSPSSDPGLLDNNDHEPHCLYHRD